MLVFIGDKLRRALESQEGLSLQAQTCETQTGSSHLGPGESP
jgi:hypothetical protein